MAAAAELLEGPRLALRRFPRRGPVIPLMAVSLLAFILLVSVSLHSPGHIAEAAGKVRDKIKNVAQGASGNSTSPVLVSTTSDVTSDVPEPSLLSSALHAAASNRTLGAESIRFINLPHRHDRFDSLAIQTYLADIDVELAPAFPAEEAGPTSVGMPPTSQPGGLNEKEVACWRAHADIWQKMLMKRTPAVVVIESDAGWDVNLRAIMGTLNEPFLELLRQDNPGVAINATADDPWASRSGLWDLMGIGHCFDGSPENGSYRVYADEHAPMAGYKWREHELNGQRVVYRADRMVCTTGYVISLSGAAKLLVRTAMNLDQPVDLVMNDMLPRGELTAYSVRQQPIAQWVYAPSIGMEMRSANSDIRSNGSDSMSGDTGGNDGWAQVQKTGSAWDLKPVYRDAANFRDFALAKAWSLVQGPGKEPYFVFPHQER